MAARYMTTAEVAELTRVSPETVRWWRYAGKGPKSFVVPGGRRVLYDVESVTAWLDAARESTSASA